MPVLIDFHCFLRSEVNVGDLTSTSWPIFGCFPWNMPREVNVGIPTSTSLRVSSSTATGGSRRALPYSPPQYPPVSAALGSRAAEVPSFGCPSSAYQSEIHPAIRRPVGAAHRYRAAHSGSEAGDTCGNLKFTGHTHAHYINLQGILAFPVRRFCLAGNRQPHSRGLQGLLAWQVIFGLG